MASPPVMQPQSEKAKATPLSRTPSAGIRTPPMGLRLLQLHGSAASDEAMWRRLRDAGFDEEMIKRRDKAALVAHITKLEAELREYQHHMGLLILERKDLQSKYDEVKAASELSDINSRRDLAIHVSAIAEAERREENLKKVLRIEKECVANLEKTLHEMRAESAETKVAAESKLADANLLMSNAHKKFEEAEIKKRTAESKFAEANLSNNSASRKLQELEAREDELRRHLSLKKAEWDDKEKAINLLRQSLNDTQKILQQERAKLLEQQLSLSQREDMIFERSKELDDLKNALQVARENLEKDLTYLKEGESNLSANTAHLAVREEAVVKKESQLDGRENVLLVLQESLANKEKEEIERLRVENKSILEKLKFDLEAEFAIEKKLVEEELAARQQKLGLMESDIIQRKKLVEGREEILDRRTETLVNKEADIAKNLKLLSERENHISETEKSAASQMSDLQWKREEIERMKIELEEAKNSLEDEKKQVILAHEKLEITATERSGFSVLETELKEEIDSFRTQKAELEAEVDRLKMEKEKFEAEWELIDAKKEEMQRESQLVEKERISVTQYLKKEYDNLKFEKHLMLDLFKKDSEQLALEREEFMRNMEQEYSDCFGKIQNERDAFLEDFKIQKKELELGVERRRAEIETYLKEREEAFEKDKRQELEKIHSLQERLAKELEKSEKESERLRKEREEITQERERRDKEQLEMKNSIMELDLQREKLQQARELLHADMQKINAKVEQLKELEKEKLPEVKAYASELAFQQTTFRKCSDSKLTSSHGNGNVKEKKSNDGISLENTVSIKASNATSSPTSFSWIRKYTDVIFRRSPECLSVPVMHGSPINISLINHSPRDIANNVQLEDMQHTPDMNGNIIGNINEQMFKSVAEKMHVKKSVSCKEPSLGDGCDVNSSFDAGIHRENCRETGLFTVDLRQDTSQHANGGINILPTTRKRVKDSSACTNPDGHSELLKCQKRRRQNEIAGQSFSTEEAILPASTCENTCAEEVDLDGIPARGEDVPVVPGDLSNIRGSGDKTNTSQSWRSIGDGDVVKKYDDCVLNTNLSDLVSEETTSDMSYLETDANPSFKHAAGIFAVGNGNESDASSEERSLDEHGEEEDEEGGGMSVKEKL